ncbi:MAG: group II intron reverse transcriptase/maturase [Flavobacteriales bacterium]|nr:group II intron reverse transcriptase/maturase [Flavobacteriales bacterium]
MKEREQKISEDSYQKKNRAELEGYSGVQTYMGITENNITNFNESEYGLLEQILSPTNLNLAFKKVKANKGSGGVDKMNVESLKDYLVENKEMLMTSILDGKYRPNPVRRVEIPKDNNRKRLLGIPTVVDRVIQQAIQQILSPIYERHFSDNSYGFRPRRSAHQALQKCKVNITAGYKYAVDMDLEKFFDKVNQSKLIEILSRTVKDGRVISLIHKYLNAGVMVGGKFEPTKLGVPQGGPLSPLLSNIMLNELDKELELRGHRFVRYADDLVIFTRSKRSANRVLTSIVSFIEKKLQLKVNKQKTKVAYVSRIKFLGYAFYVNKGEARLRVHPKSITKMKERIRVLTSRSNGWGNARRKEKLTAFIRGWVNYFKLADMKSLLLTIDEWYRRRLRMVIWKQWKRIRTRLRNLIKLGLPKYKAWEYANTRKSYWNTAKSPILNRTLTNARLYDAGYLFFTDYYRKVKV